jgi:hypothetical protein
MESTLEQRCNAQNLRYEQMNANISHIENVISTTESELTKITNEKELIERASLALKQVRPLLSGSSIKDCEQLANSAISSIFGFDYTVEYDLESNRFVLNKGDYSTDLSEAEGGGIITVISFVFLIYLIVKLNKRRLIILDEAFTQISDAYFDKFIEFVNQLCTDLGFDILLVSHDQRITVDSVQHAYLISNGESKKIK